MFALCACVENPSAALAESGRYELIYSTLLDGESGDTWEQVRDIAMDEKGFIYVVGGAAGPDFPVTERAFDRSFSTGGTQVGGQGASDVFVTKLSPSGDIVWSTFLGGPNYDRAYAVQVDAAGDVYLAGRAGPDFPTTPGVIQPRFAGDNSTNDQYGAQDGFVAKLSADGGRLIWSTYVGDAGPAFIRDLDIDSHGRVYLGVANVKADMPTFITATAWQPQRLDGNEGGYVRLSADAARVEYGTYFGGAGSSPAQSTGAFSVRVAKDGGVVLVTTDLSPSVAVTSGAYQTRHAGGEDIVVVKFAKDDRVAFATYLGGSGDETVDTHFLALDDQGRIYVISATDSVDFPVTTGALQGARAGPNDAFISVLSPDGSKLLASTYLGGDGEETTEGVRVTRKNGQPLEIIVSGRSSSAHMPRAEAAGQTSGAGGFDGFVAALSLDLSTLRYLTFLGGRRDDYASAVAVSPSGDRIAFGGQSESGNFPTTPGAVDRRLNGDFGGWVAILAARQDPH